MKRAGIILALGLSFLAVVMGDIDRHAQTSPKRMVDVFRVAEWLMTRENFILTDVRSAQRRAEFSLPTALSLSQTLMRIQSELHRAPDKVVVYGYEQGQDWALLEKTELPVFFLANGVEQWLSQIISPARSRSASPETVALFEKRADLSRYFGGVPRVRSDIMPAPSVSEDIARLRRRGCGF